MQLSFNEGTFPASFKTTSVTPLLKKKGLDRDDIANYRPISNLHTISKIAERLFQSRLIAHIEQSSSFNRFQSAYRRGHSTETALLRMLNDVYHAADNKSHTLLIQLDLSAAFDTIDKSTLLRRLEKTFGISGSALQWIKSYLDERSQFVHHHHHRLTSFFRATARVKRFPRMPLLTTARSCVSSTQSFNLDMSSSTHSLHVFLGLPRPLPFILSTTIFLHADTQSSGCLRSTCPNHLFLTDTTTTETLSMSSRLNSSALAFLSLSLTPHIHLIIILSVLSSLCISSAFIAHVSLPYT